MTLHHETDGALASSDLRGVDARRGLWVGLDHASIMGTELMAAILVWTGLGWLADRWLGTTPWLLVVGGLIGNFAGIYLIWMRSGQMNAAEARAIEARRHPLAATSEGGRGEH